MALDLDHHDAAHGKLHRIGAQDHCKTDNLPGLPEAFQPGANGRAGEAKRRREIGQAAPAIMPEEGDKALIRAVHDIHSEQYN